MTFVEAAIEVLRRTGKPLSVPDLVRHATRQELLSVVGRDPEGTMQTTLEEIFRSGGYHEHLVKLQNGLYGLKQYPPASEVASEPAAGATAGAEAGEAGGRRRRRRRRGRRGEAEGEATAPAEADEGDEAEDEAPRALPEMAQLAPVVPTPRAESSAEPVVATNDADEADEGEDDDETIDDAGEFDEDEARAALEDEDETDASEDVDGDEDDGEGDDDEAEPTPEELAALGDLSDEDESPRGLATSDAPIDPDEDRELRKVIRPESDGRDRRGRRRGRRERPERGERPARGERSERPERAERPERSGDRRERDERKGPQSGKAQPQPQQSAQQRPARREPAIDVGTPAPSVARRTVRRPHPPAGSLAALVEQATALTQAERGRGIALPRLLERIPGAAPESSRLLRIALAADGASREGQGRRARLRLLGGAQYAGWDKQVDAEVLAAEQALEAAADALADATLAAVLRRVQKLGPAELEAVCRWLIEASGWTGLEEVRRTDEVLYLGARAAAPRATTKLLVGLRYGGEINRRAVGELRAGLAAKGFDLGLLIALGPLVDEGQAELDGGRGVEVLDGPGLAERLIAAGFGVERRSLGYTSLDWAQWGELD